MLPNAKKCFANVYAYLGMLIKGLLLKSSVSCFYLIAINGTIIKNTGTS